MFEKLLMLILTPMINREVRKIKEDPEIIAAQESVKIALDNYVDSLEKTIQRNNEMLSKEEKERSDFWKKYNKK